MKAFNSQDKFYGKYEEDLDSVLNESETLAETCGVTADDMINSMPIILKVNALNLFFKRSKDCTTYQDGLRQPKTLVKCKLKSKPSVYRVEADATE